MAKKIIIKVLKYLTQLVLFVLLIAFLAKTDNMPAVMPEEYTEKIIEYTDRALIAVHLIRDQRIINKYSKKRIEQKDLKSIEDNEYHINVFTRIYNFLFLNNYEIGIINELKRSVESINSYIKHKQAKLHNIVDSTIIKNIINEKELGIHNEDSFLLLKNIIATFKDIEGLYILDDNNNIVSGVFRKQDFKSDIGKILKNIDKNKRFINLYEGKTHTHFVYFLKDYQKDMNVLFFLNPVYFNVGFKNINVEHQIFLFNKDYKILNSNIDNKTFLTKLEGSIQKKFILHNDKSLKIEFIKLRNIGLYMGIVYKRYATGNIILNILKLLLITLFIILGYIGVKYLYKKIRDVKMNTRPSQLELVTGALMEVSKSIKSVMNNSLERPAVINKDDVKKIISNVVSDYSDDSVEDEDRPRVKKPRKKEVHGWKLINPF